MQCSVRREMASMTRLRGQTKSLYRTQVRQVLHIIKVAALGCVFSAYLAVGKKSLLVKDPYKVISPSKLVEPNTKL